MNIKCLIFDDQASAISEISFLVGKYAPNWKILGIASTIDDCRILLQEQQTANVIFSDIHFGNQIIFDVLPELRQFKGDIIFISGDNSYAAQAFQLSAVNYMLKPINESFFYNVISNYQGVIKERINNAAQEVLFHNLNTNDEKKKIAFNTSNGYIIKQLEDIIYAKANSNYTEFFFTGNEKIITTKTMLEYEKMLTGFGFIRIHQSYLVNFNYVLKFESEHLLLHIKNLLCSML